MKITKEMREKSPFLAARHKARNTKSKKARLEAMLARAGLNKYVVEYRRSGKHGWFIVDHGFAQRIGYDFYAAQLMLSGPVLKFLQESDREGSGTAREKEAKEEAGGRQDRNEEVP